MGRASNPKSGRHRGETAPAFLFPAAPPPYSVNFFISSGGIGLYS